VDFYEVRMGVLDALQFLDHNIFGFVDQFFHGESPYTQFFVGRFIVRG
jgi:hypothetical protein